MVKKRRDLLSCSCQAYGKTHTVTLDLLIYPLHTRTTTNFTSGLIRSLIPEITTLHKSGNHLFVLRGPTAAKSLHEQKVKVTFYL